MTNPTERFSQRVENYAKCRPGYSPEIIPSLQQKNILPQSGTVADVGAGTGIFTALLLDAGFTVHAVEPNAAMRETLSRVLGEKPNLTVYANGAESTGVPGSSLDAVIAAQAFHWFDPAETRTEFKRILKPEGYVVLIWNDRRTQGTPFLEDYENLILHFGTDYKHVGHNQHKPEKLAAFFAPNSYNQLTFSNQQVFDYEGLEGRLLSSSYVPAAGHPQHEPMLEALKKLFQKHQRDGKIAIDYDTQIYYGKL